MTPSKELKDRILDILSNPSRHATPDGEIMKGNVEALIVICAEEREKSEDRLRAVLHLVESDVGTEADCVKLDILQGRPVDEKTKGFAELITRIYTLVHPTSGCGNKHEDWERENAELMEASRDCLKDNTGTSIPRSRSETLR